MKRMMSEHGREIWKAWADGMAVQYWSTTSSGWIDTEPPVIIQPRQPQNAPRFWRIKPAPKTIRYRIWLMSRGKSACPMVHEIASEGEDPSKFETERKVEALECFMRWDGPERMTEVEVDE